VWINESSIDYHNYNHNPSVRSFVITKRLNERSLISAVQTHELPYYNMLLPLSLDNWELEFPPANYLPSSIGRVWFGD
jgi:hypothetical protein